jgi:hypothetical protein
VSLSGLASFMSVSADSGVVITRTTSTATASLPLPARGASATYVLTFTADDSSSHKRTIVFNVPHNVVTTWSADFTGPHAYSFNQDSADAAFTPSFQQSAAGVSATLAFVVPAYATVARTGGSILTTLDGNQQVPFNMPARGASETYVVRFNIDGSMLRDLAWNVQCAWQHFFFLKFFVPLFLSPPPCRLPSLSMTPTPAL